MGAKLDIHRGWNLVGAAVMLLVYVNGEQVGTLKNGERKTFKIDDGRANVQLRGDTIGITESELVVAIAKAGETVKMGCHLDYQVMRSAIRLHLDHSEG
jgi:hypothetical protein